MAWLGNLFGGGSSSGRGNEFVGQYVDIGQQNLRIKKVLAEGGYGFVFIAQDSSSGKHYALKRLMSMDESSNKDILKEIAFLRKLRGHPNIIQYIAAGSGSEKQAQGLKEYLILTELCSGQLINYLNTRSPISYMVCLQIFAQTCRAVAHLHKQTPSIIHRDLKIENLLISEKGVIKLCDFGSATTEALYPDESWTALQRSMTEDEIQRSTTPMYRAPEMVDLYSNCSITVKADVWALGCVLYVLCFTKHPFEDSAKLKIMNANYIIPESDQTFQNVHHLISSMLQVNPESRPNVEDIHAELIVLASDKNINLKAPIVDQQPSVPVSTPEQEGTPVGGFNVNSAQLLGNVVNKAGSLFSNIKDASHKVMSSVAGYVNKDLDISYITPRLLVMSFPADGIEGTYKNNIEDVRTYLDSKHAEHYVVVNTSQRTYRTAKLNDRVYELGWNPKRTPPLDKLVSLCRKLNNFLKQNKKNVVVVHCLDGRMASGLLLVSLFLFTKLFTKVSMAEDLFDLKRMPVGQKVNLMPSQRRYAGYVARLVALPRFMPHKNIIFLKSFTMTAVPIFNKARNGCRPFIEIYEDNKRILSTAQEVEQMREYTVADDKIVFNTHIKICGDITIHVHHGRSTLGGKVQGKLTSIHILSLQFHTGFLEKDNSNVKFGCSQLDIQESLDKYPPQFGVVMSLKVTDEVPDNTYTEPWEKMHVEKLSPYACFTNKEEYWKLYEEFGLSDEKTPLRTKPSTSSISDSDHADTPAFHTGHSTFFGESGPITNSSEPKSEPKGNGFVNTSFNPIKTPTHEVPQKLNDGLSSLIDIGTPSPSLANEKEPFSDFTQHGREDFFANPSTAANENTTNQGQETLIDPFASLTTTRKSPTELPNDDILLNFGQPNDSGKQPEAGTPLFQIAPELLNTNSGAAHQTTPDLLPSGNVPSNITAKSANTSFDDLSNDDFFSRLSSGTTPAASPLSPMEAKYPTDPFMKHPHSAPRKSNSESNLLEIGENGYGGSDTLKPETNPLHHAASSGSVSTQSQSYDPFGDLGSFGVSSSSTSASGFGNNTRQQPMASTQMRSNSARSSPTFNKKINQPMQPQPHQKQPTAQPRQQAPNYNVFMSNNQDSVFGGGGKKPAGGSGTWGTKPMSHNDFSDILNAQGFSASKTGPGNVSLKQLKNEQETAEMDPIKKLVRDWSDGKERNIRALISSLESVLWEDAREKWTPIKLNELMQGNKVKKFYRKACLAVHPDKHMGTENEQLARTIFLELNEAMTLFEESGSQNLF